MKVNRKDITNTIKELIGNGIINGEEADITTKKIVDALWPLICYQSERSKKQKPTLTDSAEIMTGEVIRMGTMHIKGEMLTGVFVSCDLEEFNKTMTNLLYMRVKVIPEDFVESFPTMTQLKEMAKTTGNDEGAFLAGALMIMSQIRQSPANATHNRS